MLTDSLLAIDVDTELRNLAEAQLQGLWQLPAELARLAVARGASSVEIELRKRGVELRAPNACITWNNLRNLATAVDRRAASHQRHQALVDLEGSGSEALLWCIGVPRVHLRIECLESGCALEWPVQGRPKLDEPCQAVQGGGLRVHVTGKGLCDRRARWWTMTACRFARVAIRINGTAVVKGFPDAIYRMRIERPLPGQLAITSSGDTPRLWLLRHGIVATQATVPGYPAFAAAVELSSLVSHHGSPARLREALTGHLNALIDQAVSMMIRVVAMLPEADIRAHDRLSVLLLRAASAGVRRTEIEELAMLRLAGPGPQSHSLSLVELKELTVRRASPVYAIEPGDNPDHFSLGGEPALALSASGRALIAELVGAHLVRPPLVEPRMRLRSALSPTAHAAGELLRRLNAKTLCCLRATVNRSRLSEAERALLTALRLSHPQLDFHFCRGRGMVARVGRKMIMPRSAAVVEAAARLVAQQPEWVYPFLLALKLEGPEVDHARQRWLETLRS